MNMTLDYKKEYKEYYLPKDKPSIVEIPKMNFIAVRGNGDPNEVDGNYQKAIGLLYGIAYTLKMSYKSDYHISNFVQYVVPPLEGLWLDEIDYNDKSKLRWISLIRLPDFISYDDYLWAVKSASEKKKQDFSSVEFLTYDEGLCVQCMHIGRYDDEPNTIRKMKEFIDLNDLVVDINDSRYHHELYLSDPRKTEVSKLKTVIRVPVKRKEIVYG